MKMQRLAYITNGHSNYDDKLYSLLDSYYHHMWELGDVNASALTEEFDYLNCADIFLMAGASIKTTSHEGLTIFTVEIPEGTFEDFYKRLDKLLYEKYIEE